MEGFYLGIDNGGSWIKVIIFDKKGKEILNKRQRAVMELPGPGLTERNMDLLWKMNCQAIRSGIEQSGINPENIRAVGFSGHGKGLYLSDENGNPCARGIISTDSRGNVIEAQWRKDGTEKLLLPRIFQPLVGCQPLCLAKWFQLHCPEALSRARWIFGVKDYLRFRMTGTAAAEITDFSGSGFVNLQTAAYDPAILKQTGLEEIQEKLPPLIWPSDMAGTVSKEAAAATGIPEGTICGAGVFDIDACALGMGLNPDSEAAVIAGTWGINEYISRSPVTDRPERKNSLYCIPGFYLTEESSPTSAGNLDWILQIPFGENVSYEDANRLAETVEEGSRGLYFYPFLFGGESKRAAFLGMSADHTRAHLIRSVMEGVVFYHRVQLEALFSSRPFPEQILLGGGVLNSPLWVQIFADVLNRPIILTDCKETGALGAAMTAAVACGDFSSYEETIMAMVHRKPAVRPRLESAEVYERHFQIYTQEWKI